MSFRIRSRLSLIARWFQSDARYLDKNVPLAEKASHANFKKHLQELGNHPGLRILEVGSREVTGKSCARQQFSNAEYTGFDLYPGPNVDVAGDAHRLSEYFPDTQFDLIYSSACFEHFAMPWIVAPEMVKLLRVGGILFVETHFSYSSHERPWNFFQFSDMGLRVLFSPELGMECIEAGMSNPMVGRFSSLADEYLRFNQISGLYCHSEYLGRKVEEKPNFEWKSLNPQDLVMGTTYPPRREID